MTSSRLAAMLPATCVFYSVCVALATTATVSEGASCLLPKDVEDFENGKVYGYNEDPPVLTYVCDVGYKLQGESTRYCISGDVDGSWSGTVPTCVFNNMPDLNLDCNNLPDGEVSGNITWPSLEKFSEELRSHFYYSRLYIEISCLGDNGTIIRRYYGSVRRASLLSHSIELRHLLNSLDVNIPVPLATPNAPPNSCSAVYAVQGSSRQAASTSIQDFRQCRWSTNAEFPVAQ